MKVFVSSTTKDLGEARKKVCERLLSLDIQPVSMDFYASHPDPPKQLDHDKVKESDAFVIIVGHLYRESPSGKQKSFTELEYEAAIGSEKPVYAFLASDEFRYDPCLREDDATNKKLHAFRDRLTKEHSPRPFDNPDHLCVEVIAALAPVAKSMGKLLLPMIPAPYLAHPYPLQENFTGRLKERAMLTEWVRAQEGKSILSMVGMGGLGKSALTWYWLHADLLQENLGFSGVLWWSFYEREASFESFLSHAVLYASAGTIDPAQRKSVVSVVEKELLTPYGLRTLSPKDSRYKGVYAGPRQQRDQAYHQGTVWPYLMGAFVEAYLKVNDFSPESKDRAAGFTEPLMRHLTEDACLGSVSEIFDGDEPHKPRGCIAQAWSIAELIRAYQLIHS